MNIVWALLIFTVVVIIHELGHFLLARKHGITVTEFSVGMGPRLISFEKGGTRYSIKLLPLGGSCMMVGEDEVSDDPNAFNKKSVWARISVIFSGPLFNFILAFLLSLVVIGGVGYDPAYVVQVESGSPAAVAGLQEGDLITSFDGKRITIGRDLSNYLTYNALSEEPIEVVFQREGEKQKVVLQPTIKEAYYLGFTYYTGENVPEIASVTAGGAMDQAGILAGDVVLSVNGIKVANGTELNQYFNGHPLSEEPVELEIMRNEVVETRTITPIYGGSSYSIGMSHNVGRVKTGFFGTIKYSLNEVRYWITSTIDGLGQMVTGKVSKDDIAGPVGIVEMIGNTYEQSKEDGF